MPTPATVVRDVIKVLPKFTRWTIYYPWVIYGTPEIRVNAETHNGRITRLDQRPVALDALRKPPPRARREARGGAAHGGAAVPRTRLSRHHTERRRRAAQRHQARAVQLFSRQGRDS